ncbi:MAG TPA: CDP-diacylglycerol--glycerol-3-phosphate 3-phosphatidyltransferase [Candidatus Cloacimonadota bacterium]|nr:CDP-diacylglycerol--glycerol-3-phosphate 3-phosphatidyltransferase [Candidatus Cloacimonadota bacterium]
MNRNVPNALTLARILVIPVFAWFLFAGHADSRILISLIIFVLASFTDYLDGALARKYNIISNFGKIMDPLADKLLVLTALAGLTWLEPYRLPWLIFVLIFLREAVITILREVYKKKGIIVAADKLGKFKTVTQMCGIIIAFSVWASGDPTQLFRLIVILWFWGVTVLTLISGMNYLKPQKKG